MLRERKNREMENCLNLPQLIRILLLLSLFCMHRIMISLNRHNNILAINIIFFTGSKKKHEFS